MRRILTVLVMVGLVTWGTASAATAAPPPTDPTPTQCLDAFENTDEDYVGDGWVGALVSGPPTIDWFNALFDDTDREYSLFCGNELTGVAHIGHPDTSGSGRLISVDDEDFFLRCWGRTIANGRAVPDKTPGRTRFILDISNDQQSIAIVDDERRFTYTLFTTGERSNDWLPCIVVLN